MKAFSKFGLLLAVALMACAALAVSAQAQTINPDNTLITGTAADPTLNYEGTIVVCDTGTAIGTTGTDSAVVDVEVQFFDNCNVNGLGATVDCTEDEVTRLRALTADTNLGEVDELLTGFSCVVTVPGVCTVTVGAQQLPISGGQNSANLLNEGGATVIDADVDVNATRVGSSLCGPTNGVMALTADYDVDPDISFD
jgi:hypothetical protein